MRAIAASDPTLVIEQETLDLEAAAKAGERTVGADDPVARCNDRQWIGAVCSTHGARRGRSTDRSGNGTVRCRLAIGNVDQGLPDRLLERRPGKVKWQIERRQLAPKISAKLGKGLLKERVIPPPDISRSDRSAAAREADAMQTDIVTGNEKRADRALQIAVSECLWKGGWGLDASILDEDGDNPPGPKQPRCYEVQVRQVSPTPRFDAVRRDRRCQGA